jgi:uncharacterized phage protein gp47/JayE
MPFQTPTLRQVRSQNRDYIVSRINAPLLPNSETRILSDAGGGLAHLTLQYLDWLALQLMPDTAETEWLDRQGNIWLVNSDGSTGRKGAYPASGTVSVGTSVPGTVIPIATQFTNNGSPPVLYASTDDVAVGGDGVAVVPIMAINPGTASNALTGDQLGFAAGLQIPGITGAVTVITLTGGTDEETDDELRARVLQRIRNPPMGGDAADYEKWLLEYPGVTRAWCSPLEQGVGTTTLRFMMDDLRASTGGFPSVSDVASVQAFINTVRPVTVLDCFVVAPLREPITFTLQGLVPDDSTTLANITASVRGMLLRKAAPAFQIDGIAQPAQTIYAAWVSDAVMQATGVNYFTLVMDDHPMPTPGSLATLGSIILG